MISWYDIVKSNPKRYNIRSYFFVRYFRLAIISIPLLLLFFVLPQLGWYLKIFKLKVCAMHCAST